MNSKNPTFRKKTENIQKFVISLRIHWQKLGKDDFSKKTSGFGHFPEDSLTQPRLLSEIPKKPENWHFPEESLTKARGTRFFEKKPGFGHFPEDSLTKARKYPKSEKIEDLVISLRICWQKQENAEIAEKTRDLVISLRIHWQKLGKAEFPKQKPGFSHFPEDWLTKAGKCRISRPRLRSGARAEVRGQGQGLGPGSGHLGGIGPTLGPGLDPASRAVTEGHDPMSVGLCPRVRGDDRVGVLRPGWGLMPPEPPQWPGSGWLANPDSQWADHRAMSSFHRVTGILARS
jgi:hypothetical protein